MASSKAPNETLPLGSGHGRKAWCIRAYKCLVMPVKVASSTVEK